MKNEKMVVGTFQGYKMLFCGYTLDEYGFKDYLTDCNGKLAIVEADSVRTAIDLLREHYSCVSPEYQDEEFIYIETV